MTITLNVGDILQIFGIVMICIVAVMVSYVWALGQMDQIAPWWANLIAAVMIVGIPGWLIWLIA